MNEIHTINGVSKPFLDWCTQYGVFPLQVRALMSTGNTLEDALEVKIRKHNILMCLHGRVQPMRDWCAQYGITTSTLRARANLGYTLEEAFEKQKFLRNKTVVCGMVEEYSLSKRFLDWCRDYMADPLHVRACMSLGYSLHHALRNAPLEMINFLHMRVNGRHGTFLELCKHHKIASNTMRRRIALGMSLDDAFMMERMRKGDLDILIETERANEPMTITQSLIDWCHDYNQPRLEVERRLEAGLTLEQALQPLAQKLISVNGETILLSELCNRLGQNTKRVKLATLAGKIILEAIYDATGRQLKGRKPVDGAVLKLAREDKGYSMAKIAMLCNEQYCTKFTRHIIVNLERETRMVSEQERHALCAVLEIEPDYLCPPALVDIAFTEHEDSVVGAGSK